MANLCSYGWNNQWQQLKNDLSYNELEHGRIISTHKTRYDVATSEGILSCELTGNILYTKEPHEYPITGDWVVFQRFGELGIIIDILPRTNALSRKRSGTKTSIQHFAANIDKAFIVQSCDANFNVRRTERFLIQVIDSGIVPVLILTKADLGADIGKLKQSLGKIGEKTEVFVTSIYDKESIDRLRKIINPAETFIFIGSSGVGKSSLINRLCDDQLAETSAISTSTGKGKHTSTRREIFLLESGGILLDTPGVREFGLAVDSDDTIAETLDIDQLMGKCKFHDCTHTSEPGCAVLNAIASGDLDIGTYNSYLKLKREAMHFNETTYERRERERQFHRMVKEVIREKRSRDSSV